MNVEEMRARGLEWLRTQASDETVRCHAFMHGFLGLDRQAVRVGLMRAERQPKGAFQIIEPCPNGCGTVRTFTTMPRGHIGPKLDYKYEYPEDRSYNAPKGADLTSEDYRNEYFRRIAEDVRTAAARKLKAVNSA